MLFKTLKQKLLKNPNITRLFRIKFKPSDFLPEEFLYRCFRLSDCDEETGDLEVNSIRFPDFSCNWSRFSSPVDIRHRNRGQITDGCYSFTVEQARYNEMATACHDPFPKTDRKNYAHTEVRQLKPDESVCFEPPKKRKLKKEKDGWSPSQRLDYRQHIASNLNREIEPLG